MPRSSRTPTDALDTLLESLPDSFVVAPLGAARLVAGAPGIHLVVAHDPEQHPGLDPAALALRLRAALAEHLTLVPFVQPLLLADEDVPGASATLVPSRHLVETLTEGMPILSEHTVTRIGNLAARGLLAPQPDPVAGLRGWDGAAAIH